MCSIIPRCPTAVDRHGSAVHLGLQYGHHWSQHLRGRSRLSGIRGQLLTEEARSGFGLMAPGLTSLRGRLVCGLREIIKDFTLHALDFGPVAARNKGQLLGTTTAP